MIKQYIAYRHVLTGIFTNNYRLARRHHRSHLFAAAFAIGHVRRFMAN